MKFYVASPLFTDMQRQAIKMVANRLRADGHDVYVPMEDIIPDAWQLPNHEWAKQVYTHDFTAIQNADIVVGIIYGMTDDAGTAWEIGYSHAIGKEVHLWVTTKNLQSLMIINSANKIFNSCGEEVSAEYYAQS